MTDGRDAVADERAFPSAGRAWLMLAMLLAAYMLSLVDRQILSLMVGPIRRDLEISDFQISLLQGFAFTLLYCGVGLPVARLADKHNRKYLILAGIVIWSIMTGLCGLAGSFGALFLARVGVGFGEAALTPAAYSMISDAFPPHKLVRANAIFSMAALMGAGLSLVLGGPLVEFFTAQQAARGITGFAAWQLVFLTLGVLGLPVSLLFLLVREPARHGARAPVPPVLGAVGQLWADRARYMPYYLCAGLLAIVTFGVLSWVPAHMMRVFAMTPGEVGLMVGCSLVAAALLGAVIGPALAHAFSRRGHADCHLRTTLVVTLCLLPTLLAPVVPSKPVAFTLLFLLFVLQSSYFGVLAAAIQLLTPGHVRAVNASIFILTVNVMGMGVGTALIGGLSDLAFAGDPAGIGRSITIVTGGAALIVLYVTISATRGGRAARDIAAVSAAAYAPPGRSGSTG